MHKNTQFPKRDEIPWSLVRPLAEDDVVNYVDLEDLPSPNEITSDPDIGITGRRIPRYAACGISGDSSPSESDVKMTRDLIRAGQMLRIEVLDHIVMGHPNHTSLRELGCFA